MSVRRLYLCLLAALLLFPASARAQAEGWEAEAASQLQGYDLRAWEEAARSFSEETRALWQGKTVAEWMQDYALGRLDPSYDTWLARLWAALQAAVRENGGLLALLLCVALLTGVLGMLLDDAQGIREIVSLLCCGLSAGTVAAFFIRLLRTANETLTALGEFAELATPILSAMLCAAGSVTSAGMLRPLMAFLSGGVTSVFRYAVLPCIAAAGVMSVAGSVSGRQELKRMSGLLKSLCKWSIGLLFTVYMGIVTLQGMSVAGVDSIGLRTAKYTLDKTLPVVGGAVSGTLDTVRGCAVLIKNAAGAATVLLTLACALHPALQIAAAIWSMRLCAALAEPISDGRIPALLGEMAELCNYLLAAVTVAAVMFMILAGLAMAVGNG